MKQISLRAVGLVFGLLLISPLLPLLLNRLVLSLLLGWYEFLARNIRQLTLNWDLIGMGVVCSILILLLGHALLRAMFSLFRRSLTVQWCWRWTVSLYAVVWLLFLIAFGSAGVLRHTVWLAQHPEPMYQPRRSHLTRLSAAEGLVFHCLSQNKWNLKATRDAFMRSRLQRDSQRAAEEFQAIFFGDTNQQVAACLVIPRKFESARTQFELILDTRVEFKPMSELAQTIKTLDATYPESSR